MTVRYLYLIRHAQPEGDGVPRFLGQGNPPLSPRGRAEARRLGAYLRPFPPEAVYCSPLLRGVETARFLTPSPTPVPGLEEIDLGAWEGLPRAEVRARFPELYAARGRDNAHCAPPGGVRFTQAAARAWAALSALLASTRGDLAVVGHAGIHRTILCTALHRPLGTLLDIPQHYCGVSVLRVTEDGLEPETIDEILWRPGPRNGAPGPQREEHTWKSC